MSLKLEKDASPTSFEVNAFLNDLKKALYECQEYDVLPHIDDQNHTFLNIHPPAFAICKCTINILYKQYSSKDLTSVENTILIYLLLINPNTISFWNQRRRSILKGTLLPEEDLNLTLLISKKYPRSFETIFHRQWVIQYKYRKNEEILRSELQFCSLVADKYRCHYAIWQYRRLLLNCLGSEIYIDEFDSIRKWLDYHPTDISGWNYLSHVLELIITHRNSNQIDFSMKFLKEQFNFVEKILELYPERESVWMFKRNLILFWIQIRNDNCNNIELIRELIDFDPLIKKSMKFAKYYNQKRSNYLSFKDYFDWYKQLDIGNKEFLPLNWINQLTFRHILWLCESVCPNLCKLSD